MKPVTGLSPAECRLLRSVLYNAEGDSDMQARLGGWNKAVQNRLLKRAAACRALKKRLKEKT